jgi:4-hydroxybenzoate polyprenyltransferase
MSAFLQLCRPYTLLAPGVGIACGSIIAWQSSPLENSTVHRIILIVLASLSSMILNAASNIINEVYDLDIDRINKPQRPIPSGKVNVNQAKLHSFLLYSISLSLAALINTTFLSLVAIAAAATILYSVPPLRTKEHWLLAALTISIPRGVLLKVAGWSVLCPIWVLEPWLIGSVYGLFLLGASATKDFSDIKGDAAHGCKTLPVRFGVHKAAWMIAPFFFLPFLLLSIGANLEWYTGDAFLIHALGLGMCAWGAYVVYLILHNPSALAHTENHPSWKHMYLMMMVSQITLSVAYLI